MRLNIINPYLSRSGGGIFTVLKELYGTTAFKTSQSIQLNFWGFEDEYSHSDKELLPGNKKIFQLKWAKLNKLYYSKKFKSEFTSSIKNEDLIHLHSLWLSTSLIILLLQQRKNVKKIISVHGMLDPWALKNGYFKKKIILALFEKRNLDTAFCIHALCKEEYLQIRKICHHVPVAVIPNGVNLPAPGKVDANEKKKLKKLVFLGRIHPKKGLKNLIYAWKTSSARKNWKLIIAGPDENNHRFELEKIVKHLDLETEIKFVGPQFGESKKNILHSADAFILPSFSEGLPMSVLEAWSYKLPVLMTPQCNLPEGFEYDSAIQIEANTVSICEGLNFLSELKDQELRRKGLNGYNLVLEKYTWESVSQMYLNLYDWVYGKKEKPSFIYLD